jgi:hypothetical protein
MLVTWLNGFLFVTAGKKPEATPVPLLTSSAERFIQFWKIHCFSSKKEDTLFGKEVPLDYSLIL